MLRHRFYNFPDIKFAEIHHCMIHHSPQYNKRTLGFFFCACKTLTMMAEADSVRAKEYVAIAERLVADKKILIDAGFDLLCPAIKDVPRLMAETKREQQSAMLSLATNDFTTATGEFLFLMKDGKAVAGERAKVVDLQDETFESHQRRTIQQWYSTDDDMIVSLAKPLNGLITGKHIYTGELEFHPDFRGNRAVTTAFVRILIASALMKWPDATCVYCILPEKHRRIAMDYGFSTTVRNAFKWREPIPGGRLHDWLVAVSSRDQLLHDLVDGYWGPAPHVPA